MSFQPSSGSVALWGIVERGAVLEEYCKGRGGGGGAEWSWWKEDVCTVGLGGP
jgi:hypothetical protein